MSEGGGGWTFLRIIGVLVGLVGMVGFGICSVCGLLIGGGDGEVLMLALGGAALATFFGWLLFRIFRKVRDDRDRGT